MLGQSETSVDTKPTNATFEPEQESLVQRQNFEIQVKAVVEAEVDYTTNPAMPI